MKILLNIFSNEVTEQDFMELSEPFNSEKYMVFNFQYPTSDYYLDFINTLMNYLSVEYGINPYETRIIVQSNIFNLLVSWYRLYNDVIDDFIIVDRHITYFHSKDSDEELFVNLLSSLAGMEQDHCHDRLYYRYSNPIDLEILKPFIESYQYDLLQPFEDLEIHFSSVKKEKREKEYKYKKWSCTRVTAEKEKISYSIDLTKKNKFQNDIHITKINRSSGYFFILYYILTLPIQDMEKAKIAYMLNNRMTVEQKKKVTNYILNYLENNLEEQLPYKLVINLYSFIVMLGQNKNVLKRLLKYIKNDEKNYDDHYALFTNVLFYISKGKQKEYEDYFRDRIDIAGKLKKYYRSKISIGKCKRSKNKLVIVAGQLLSYNHAPTKIVIDYANNLKKYFPELQIKLIVEDMFNYSPNELFFVYPFSSADSSSLRNEHRKLLHSSIEIYYSNSKLSRIKRLQEDIDAITRFKPQWILKYAAPDSLIVDQLYDYYPILSMSSGGAEYSEFVHLGIGGRKEGEVLKEREEKGLSNNGYRYHQHIAGLEFPQITKSYDRNEFDINPEDFVIVTVGNRLEVEIDETFAIGMKKILKENVNIKWLIVGVSQHHLITKLLNDVINQVKFISYANNLMDIYALCDMYANPYRKGGGISVAMAMYAGLPVANIVGKNDANTYLPDGKSLSKEDYFKYIQALTTDKEYCKKEGKKFQKHIIDNFTFERAILNIFNLLNKAEQIFLYSKK